MADIADVIKSRLQHKSKFVKIKNKLSRYTIKELRSFTKDQNLKIIGQNLK